MMGCECFPAAGGAVLRGCSVNSAAFPPRRQAASHRKDHRGFVTLPRTDFAIRKGPNERQNDQGRMLTQHKLTASIVGGG